MAIPEKIAKSFTSIFAPPKEEEKKEPEVSRDLLAEKGKKVVDFTLKIEQMHAAAETFYFWIINHLRNPIFLGYDLEKTSDLYSATESSSYFGNIETRKSFQQEKASTYLATIGSMTKSMFQMIRELRIIDERLDYYEKSTGKRKRGETAETYEERVEGAEIALKSIWTDLVEGGPENAMSIFGLARKVGYVILPDLFFKIHPKDGSKGVDREVNKLEGINERVKSLLKNKLFQYYVWKERTWKELEVRKRFVLKSFNQHYQTIKMYMHWVKPYLRHIGKMQFAAMETPELVTAFESARVELEILATKKKYELETRLGIESREFQHYFPVIRVKFSFITLPEMAFAKEYQHRGAVHAGRTEIFIEAFVASKDTLDKYRKIKEDEDLELMGAVNASVEELRQEMEEYLKEAGAFAEKEKAAKKEEISYKGMIEPFTSIFKGFGEVFGRGKEGRKASRIWAEREAAESIVLINTYKLYDIFKKAHNMLNL